MPKSNRPGANAGPQPASYAMRPPDARLVGMLARDYVGFRQENPSPGSWLEPAQPTVTLMVSLEGDLTANGRTLPAAWLSGVGVACDEVSLRGPYAALDIKMTPLGAYKVLGPVLGEVGTATVSLDQLFGSSGRQLAERVHAARDWDGRFREIDTFLLQRAADGFSSGSTAAGAWSRLVETSGLLPVAAIADELGCSRRHLSAAFREQVGQPPKMVARLLRFERVRRMLETQPSRWADIAIECGYYDQSHLNRDFRDLAGTTPTHFVARRLASGSGGDAVTIVQDGGRVAR